MHDNSFNLMKFFVGKYINKNKNINILDVGSLDINGTYKPLFENNSWKYIGLDLIEGKNVDIVSENLYRYPFEDESFDVVVSGNCLEHVKDIFLWVKECGRLLKNNGFLCIISPNSIHYHPEPIDCWRVRVDGMRYLLSDVCGLDLLYVCEHGMDTIGIAKKQKIKRKVYDCFMFFDEIEMLKIRLNELYDYVDFFVICESECSFQGEKKDLVLKDKINNEFSKFADKIRYLPLYFNNIPKTEDPWVREEFQRNNLICGLGDSVDDDIIILSDVDEIPRIEHVICEMQYMDGLCFSIEQSLNRYFLNVSATNFSWKCPKIFFKSYLEMNKNFHKIRMMGEDKVDNIIRNGGWHFSSCGDVNFIRKKQKSFSHVEYNKLPYNDVEYLKQRIEKIEDLYHKDINLEVFYDFSNRFLPKHVEKNINYFIDKKMIKVDERKKKEFVSTKDIAICVMTADCLKHRYTAVMSTWGRDFENIFYFGGEKSKDKRLIPLKGVNDDYDSAFYKEMFGLKYMYNICKDSKWYYVCGCDTFIYSENICKELEKYDSNKDFFIGGHSLQFRDLLKDEYKEGSPNTFPSGGSGFFISNSLLSKIYDKIDKFIIDWPVICKDFFISLRPVACDVAISFLIWKYFNIYYTKIHGMYAGPPSETKSIILKPLTFHYICPNLMIDLYSKKISYKINNGTYNKFFRTGEISVIRVNLQINKRTKSGNVFCFYNKNKDPMYYVWISVVKDRYTLLNGYYSEKEKGWVSSIPIGASRFFSNDEDIVKVGFLIIGNKLYIDGCVPVDFFINDEEFGISFSDIRGCTENSDSFIELEYIFLKDNYLGE